MENVDVKNNNAVCEVVSEVVSELTVCLSEELKDIINKKRCCWVREWVGRREEMGASSTIFRELAEEDPLEYKKVMRMSVVQFNELLSLIEPNISKRDTVMRSAIPARTKLEVGLRFLATGDSYQSLGLMFRLPANTISHFMPSVLKAIISALQGYLKVPNTVEEWVEIQRNFEAKWNFPLCVGAIDGKHVAIKRPPGTCSEYYNYKGGYSIVLLALADADCKFIYIDVGSNGRANDSTVFRQSTLKSAMDKGELNLPTEYFLLGDEAFALTPNLMKPYPKKKFSLMERIFNYRLSRARRVVENAFGILASRFRIFGREIEVDIETVDLIVQCTCTLHNWLRTKSPSTYFERGWVDYEDIETGVFHPGIWRSTGTDLPSLNVSRRANSYSLKASETRQSLAEYFSGDGRVPWQMKAIGM